MIHQDKHPATAKNKTRARFLRLLLAGSLLSIAAGNCAHAFTFIAPGASTILRAAGGNPARNESRIKEPPAGSNPGVALTPSAPDGGLRASLGQGQGPMRNAAADDAPSKGGLVVVMLVFPVVLYALKRRRAPMLVRDSPDIEALSKELPLIESQRLNTLEKLPLASAVMRPGVI